MGMSNLYDTGGCRPKYSNNVDFNQSGGRPNRDANRRYHQFDGLNGNSNGSQQNYQRHGSVHNRNLSLTAAPIDFSVNDVVFDVKKKTVKEEINWAVNDVDFSDLSARHRPRHVHRPMLTPPPPPQRPPLVDVKINLPIAAENIRNLHKVIQDLEREEHAKRQQEALKDAYIKGY